MAPASAGVAAAHGPVAFVVVAKGVTPIRTATNSAGRLIKLPGTASPTNIVITPDGKTAYVDGDQPTGAVIPINTATKRAGKPIKVGRFPDGMAITPN